MDTPVPSTLQIWDVSPSQLTVLGTQTRQPRPRAQTCPAAPQSSLLSSTPPAAHVTAVSPMQVMPAGTSAQTFGLPPSRMPAGGGRSSPHPDDAAVIKEATMTPNDIRDAVFTI